MGRTSLIRLGKGFGQLPLSGGVHPGRHKVPPLPVRAEGLCGHHLERHPQLLQEGQGRVLQRRTTFCDRLLDIRLLREGARQVAEEAAWSIRPRDVKSDAYRRTSK